MRLCTLHHTKGSCKKLVANSDTSCRNLAYSLIILQMCKKNGHNLATSYKNLDRLLKQASCTCKMLARVHTASCIILQTCKRNGHNLARSCQDLDCLQVSCKSLMHVAWSQTLILVYQSCSNYNKIVTTKPKFYTGGILRVYSSTFLFFTFQHLNNGSTK